MTAVHALVALAVVGGAILPGCGSPSAEHCNDVDLTQDFIDELRSNAPATDLTITPLGVVDPDTGCDFSTFNVERSEVEDFLVAVNISAVDQAEGASALRDEVRGWERRTDNGEHDERAATIEQALSNVDGLGEAVVEARCSESEHTCAYFVAVDGWSVYARSLYLGLTAGYGSTSPIGDELLVDTAQQLGLAVDALADVT